MQFASSLDANDDGTSNPLRYITDIFNFVFNGLFVLELGVRCGFSDSDVSFFDMQLVAMSRIPCTKVFKLLGLDVTLDYYSLFVLWWRPFFEQPWKIFDLLIVISSLLALTPWVDIPSEVRIDTAYSTCCSFLKHS